MELLVAAFVFYFVIKYAVRNAIIEAKVNEADLSFKVKVNDLLEEITSMGYEIIINTKSKELREKATEINDNCLKTSTSDLPEEDKYSLLKIEENKMILLRSEEEAF